MSQLYADIVEEVRHHFRNALSHATKARDVDEAFSRTVGSFLVRVLSDGIRISDSDIRLTPGARRHYQLASSIVDTDAFKNVSAPLELHAILSDFAEEAARRHKLLAERERTLGSQRHAQH